MKHRKSVVEKWNRKRRSGKAMVNHMTQLLKKTQKEL